MKILDFKHLFLKLGKVKIIFSNFETIFKYGIIQSCALFSDVIREYQ